MAKIQEFNLVLVFLFAMMILTSCGVRESKKKVISIGGSDTMVNLSVSWAEQFMSANPNFSVQITGGGSGIGIAGLINGTSSIANLSRVLRKSEIGAARQRNILLKSYHVAYDGIAIAVHPSNPVDSLTIDDLRDIYTGKKNNWKDFGGADQNINVYGRESSSGTYEFLKNLILGKDSSGRAIEFSSAILVLQGTAQAGEVIRRDRDGIVYGGLGYFVKGEGHKLLGIKKNAKEPAVFPTNGKKINNESIRKGIYSLARPLFCYTAAPEQPEMITYINYILSPEGQAIVREMEYIPVD